MNNMVLEILLIVSIGFICVLSYLVYNLNRKVQIYEKWLVHFRSQIDTVYDQLKVVDSRNLFEKDDDVGFVFSEIVRVVKEFDEMIK